MRPASLGVRGRLAVVLAVLLWPAASLAQDHEEHQAEPAPPPAESQADRAPDPPPAQAGPQLPPITDADRAAAFPAVDGHVVHDEAVHALVRIDRLEWRPADDNSLGWSAGGWIGRDLDRFWFRAEGDRTDGRLDEANVHLLYGRALARWWEVVAGVRQDIRPGPARTWAAVGVQGLAPYWFEVEATAYVGESGRTRLHVEAEYELLLTNRLILQPLIEVAVHGTADREYGIGAGLSSAEIGLRARYEFRRELAPYVGVVWHRAFFETAEIARAAGRQAGDLRLATGIRLWF
jgi:copper resistance protein B